MREIIEKKLTELSAQKEELLARLNAVIGAEQVLKDILGKEGTDHERSAQRHAHRLLQRH